MNGSSTARLADRDFSDSSTAYLLKQQRKAIELKRHERTITKSVNSKRLNERRLHTLLGSLEEDRSKRLLQIDKDVAEVETTLSKLISERDEGVVYRRSRSQSAKSGCIHDTLQADETGEDRCTVVITPSTDARMETVFTPGGRALEKCDGLPVEYYSILHDFGDQSVNASPLCVGSSISSSSAMRSSISQVAWDLTDFSPSDLHILSSKASGGANRVLRRDTTKSRATTLSATRSAVTFQDTDARSKITTHNTVVKPAFASQSDNIIRDDNNTTDIGVQLRPTRAKGQTSSTRAGTRNKKATLTADEFSNQGGREISTATGSLTMASKLKGQATEYQEDDGADISHRLPHRFDLESTFSETLTDDNGEETIPITNDPHVCKIPDCVFHDWTLRDTGNLDGTDMLRSYYQTSLLSRARHTRAPVIRPVFQVSGYLQSAARGARRVALSPPSPTPSDILRDVSYSPKYGRVSSDGTDLDVVRSVRRQVKGSNRERMLKDKEENVRYTFELMRSKMAAKVPEDFNVNYGRPTPKWKILNPLQIKHRIHHSSPLHRLWKQ